MGSVVEVMVRPYEHAPRTLWTAVSMCEPLSRMPTIGFFAEESGTFVAPSIQVYVGTSAFNDEGVKALGCERAIDAAARAAFPPSSIRARPLKFSPPFQDSVHFAIPKCT